jgi:outer membrane receptor protein involved in Fe transport
VIDSEFGRLTINRPQNGGKGRITGIEAGFSTFLRVPWLPEWARNFGVLANYTYLDHKSELAPTLAVTLPGMQPLSGVSKHLVNLSAFYENRWFSTRVSYNYRSDFIVSYNQVADPAFNNALGPTLPITEDGRGTLDLSSSVTPVENVTLSFNVTNLLGQAATNSRVFNSQGQSYPWQTRFLETVYRLGVRFRF